MSQNQKTIAENRKARHEYELYDRFEAGLVSGNRNKKYSKRKSSIKGQLYQFSKRGSFY